MHTVDAHAETTLARVLHNALQTLLNMNLCMMNIIMHHLYTWHATLPHPATRAKQFALP